MCTMHSAFRALVIALASIATRAQAGETDIFPQVVDGQIQTGQIDASTGTPIFDELLVYPATFGVAGIPNFCNDPGIFSPAGTFPVPSQLGFNILAPLEVWMGDGFGPTGGETLKVSFSTLSATTADGFVSGFSLFVNPDGGFHHHYGFTLNGPTGRQPLTGVYLLELELFSSSPAIAPSEPFWIVFNYQDSSEDHAAAIEWVATHLVTGSCPADLNDDGVVSGLDLAMLLGAWGPCAPGSAPGSCPADFDGNGLVNGLDLASLLGAWGACP